MIRINTTLLLRLLAELTPTASAENYSGGVPGMLFYSARGEYGDQPGKTTLLVGVSGNGRALATTHVPCEGGLDPTLLGLQDVVSLRALLGPRVKNHNDHTVDISRDLTTVTVSEPDDLFDEGDRLTLHVGDLDNVSRRIWATLRDTTPDPATHPQNSRGDTIPRLPRVDLSAGQLAPFAAVAKLRKDILQIYVTHQHRPVHIQIGAQYRGVIHPDRWARDLPPGVAVAEGQGPDADIHIPDLPPLTRKPGARVTEIRPKTQPPLPLEDPEVDPETVDNVDGEYPADVDEVDEIDENPRDSQPW